MLDSIGDEKVLKRPLKKNKALVKKAEKRGQGSLAYEGREANSGGAWHIISCGFFGQRLYFGHKTRQRIIQTNCVWM